MVEGLHLVCSFPDTIVGKHAVQHRLDSSNNSAMALKRGTPTMLEKPTCKAITLHVHHSKQLLAVSPTHGSLCTAYMSIGKVKTDPSPTSRLAPPGLSQKEAWVDNELLLNHA